MSFSELWSPQLGRRMAKVLPSPIRLELRITMLIILVFWLVKSLRLYTTSTVDVTHRDSYACPYPERNPRDLQSFKYEVYALSSESRRQTMDCNMRQFAPAFETIPAYEEKDYPFDGRKTAERVDIDRLTDRKVIVKPTWDRIDKRIRKAFDSPYIEMGQEGVAGCILGHRRLLEQFLHSSGKNYVLALEDDAIPANKDSILSQLDELILGMEAAAPNWDFIQLGRCFDLQCQNNDTRQPIATISNNTRIMASRGYEFCSHAYLVSRSGAEKILQYTVPMVIAYDQTLMLLSRTGVLESYYTEGNLFFQENTFSSLIRSSNHNDKPECDPVPKPIEAQDKMEKMESYDSTILNLIEKGSLQERVSVATRRFKTVATVVDAEARRMSLMEDLCAQGKKVFCADSAAEQVKEYHNEFCQILGGSASMFQKADAATKAFLDAMDSANLDGVLVWGLRSENARHTHKYVHLAIHEAVEAALAYSRKPRHLCYVPVNTSINIGRYVYNHNDTEEKLSRSLVFASPKHMTWSQDPGFIMLPIEASSRYIFHGETPRPHTILKHNGGAVEWETWGPSGFMPDIDSEFRLRGLEWRYTDNCLIDVAQKTKRCPDRRMLIQPWATYLTPQEIQKNEKKVAKRASNALSQLQELHFQGAVWDCNVRELIGFTKGCAEEGIDVILHSRHPDKPANSEDPKDWLYNQDNFYIEDASKSLHELMIERDQMYGPALQGSCHLAKNGSESYVADHSLNLIAMGFYPMVNNPASFELLGSSSAIVFDTNTTNLCRKAAENRPSTESLLDLMDNIAANHTYVSRLTSLLDFISNDIPTVAPRPT